MIKAFSTRSALVLGLSAVLVDPCLVQGQQKPRPASRPAARVRPERGSGGDAKQAEAPKRDSEQQIDRLQKMTSTERRAALEALPSERREKIEKRLDHLQRLSPQERAQLEKRLERFQNLSSDRQNKVRHLAQDLQQLPRERKVAVRQELDTLRTLPEGERQSRVQSSTWRNQFSTREQEILKQSSELLPPQL